MHGDSFVQCCPASARVSKDNEDTAAQVAGLQASGCEYFFHEKTSGGRWDRPQSLRLLNQLRSGDVVVVGKLDRLSRSLHDVRTIMEQLGEAEARFLRSQAQSSIPWSGLPNWLNP